MKNSIVADFVGVLDGNNADGKGTSAIVNSPAVPHFQRRSRAYKEMGRGSPTELAEK